MCVVFMNGRRLIEEPFSRWILAWCQEWQDVFLPGARECMMHHFRCSQNLLELMEGYGKNRRCIRAVSNAGSGDVYITAQQRTTHLQSTWSRFNVRIYSVYKQERF